MSRGFDLVVIGGGSAGCVVAARASEEAARQVLLVEAGPDPQPVPDVIADPARQAELVAGDTYVRTLPAQRPDGSTYPLVAGRVMGGGSSVNNLAAVRPTIADFDAWSDVGGPAWSFERLLPTLRAMETDADFPDDPLHGATGPLRLVRRFQVDGPREPIVGALLEAGAGLGLPACRDLNGREPFGIGASTYGEVDGRRQSVAAAYLDPVRGRPNLTIRAATSAVRLRLAGSHVTAVELRGPSGQEVVEADRFVLSAGVFGSPQLLVSSGIGPTETLDRLGLPVALPLAGVGRGYRDHAVIFLAFEAGPKLRSDEPIPKARVVARSDGRREPPDLHLLIRGPKRGPGGGLHLPVSVHLLDHRARGALTFVSPDGAAVPEVRTALLQHPDDIGALEAGVELACRLAASPSLAPLYGQPLLPAGVDARQSHILAHFGTYHHGVGTCALGRDGDPLAVVDGGLRVRGLENLWVADASVLPTIPRANTNLAAVMIGEMATQALQGR
ncbi:MAG TPA: GMC family oxidoreductase N-terminal domain-containing protein [Candidatus Limnocylindrales bacterium]|nr:GMC family oxidoreductase N-terminal domain-containing protein [Candidatus Limnocylindrales bacterium]